MKGREFLQISASGLAGMAGILALRHPPAMAQQRELTMLSWNHFVPASDEKLREQAAAFSKQRGVKVQVDTIAHLQLPSKLASEVQTQSGHDIVYLQRSQSYLFKKHLVPLDELAESWATNMGGGISSPATIASWMVAGWPSTGFSGPFPACRQEIF